MYVSITRIPLPFLFEQKRPCGHGRQRGIGLGGVLCRQIFKVFRPTFYRLAYTSVFSIFTWYLESSSAVKTYYSHSCTLSQLKIPRLLPLAPILPSIMAVPPVSSPKVEEARTLSKTSPEKAAAIYQEILSQKPGGTEAALREYEAALIGLGESYRDTRKPDELAELVKSSTSSLTSFTKAKTAKLGPPPPFSPSSSP